MSRDLVTSACVGFNIEVDMQEKELEAIIRKIIEKLIRERENEREDKENRPIYIALPPERYKRCDLLLEELEELRERRFHFILSGDGGLPEFSSTCMTVQSSYIREIKLTQRDAVIFPMLSRDDLADILSCRSKMPIPYVFRQCFEAGARVYLLQSGIERLTGREPKKYQEKVLGYYRELLEWEVCIQESVKAVTEIEASSRNH